MSRMPPSVQRVLAAVGMVVVGAGAGLLAFVSVLYELSAFENTEPAENPYEFVALLAAAGLATAIIGVAITAALLLFLWDSPRWYALDEYDREDTAFNAYLVAVMLADAVLLLAALRRPATKVER